MNDLIKTSLIFGPSGAGKTALCASYPRVAILSSRREDGLETVRWMDPVMWYEPKVPPQTFPVENITDLMTRLHKEIIPKVMGGYIQTICIELTFYADDVMRTMPVDEKNGWAKYANLEQHVVTVDELVKKVPGLRVVYNTLAQPEDNAKSTSGVLIPGKALAKKIPAMVSLTGYLHAEEGDAGTERVLELGAYGNYSPRHRYGNRLPRRVRWRGPACCFRDLEDLLKGKVKVDDAGCVVREPTPVVSLPPLKKSGG